MLEEQEIEKPWVVYGLTDRFIGRVVVECKESVDILSTEGQLYPPRFGVLVLWRDLILSEKQ